MLIAVSTRSNLIRIALLDGDNLREFLVHNPAQPDGIGDVHTARITAIAPAMSGAFVDLGGATGFLPARGGLTEGDIVTVEIIRAAQGGKGPRLARSNLAPADRAGLLQPGPGPIAALAARFPAAPMILDDHALIASLRLVLKGRMTFRAAAFDAVLEDEILGLADPIAALPEGAAMHITPAPALTAIDIDSAAATSRPQSALNQSLIPEITRQIILRNLSGAILLDFAGMKTRDRAKLGPALAAALAKDPLRPKLLGFTQLGFAEITRPRIHPPLHEIFRP